MKKIKEDDNFVYFKLNNEEVLSFPYIVKINSGYEPNENVFLKPLKLTKDILRVEKVDKYNEYIDYFNHTMNNEYFKLFLRKIKLKKVLNKL